MIRDLVVELVSPAMVGGAVAGQCDEPSRLRVPSLRGHLRFWTKALGGAALESCLWGDTDTGQRVRLLLARTHPGGDLPKPKTATLIPPKPGERPRIPAGMVPPGDKVLLRFAFEDDALFPKLQAVVWTWLHLGAVGRRSRRGYGSLLWKPARGDLLAGWPPLWPSHHLRSRGELEEYLRGGFERVTKELGVPGKQPRRPGGRLTTVDQVFVGKKLVGEWEVKGGVGGGHAESLEAMIHGLNERHRGGGPEKRQLGTGNPRLPSPMLWRMFPAYPTTGFRPVMTWFPDGYGPGTVPAITEGGALYGYLHGTLGFEKSLARRGLVEGEEDAEDGADGGEEETA